MTTISESKVGTYEIIQPTKTNTYGNAHGGELVKLMDELAAISARRVSKNPCVTAKISEVNFNTPIREGDIIELEAFVYETGDTSLEIYVQVNREEVDEKEHATTARFTFVAIDDDGDPINTNEIRIESEEDEELHSKATQS